MCRAPSSAKGVSAPVVWSSLVEHAIKTALYAAIALHAIASARRSATTFSYCVNATVGAFALWMTKGEAGIAMKRVYRKLPPGYLGFPVIREVKFFIDAAKGNTQRGIERLRCKYGSMFLQSFVGRLNIVMGGQDDLKWIFNNDSKGLMEVSWPPNIAALLGPGAVANQNGKYHRVLRRLLEPYFAPKFVKNYLKVMDETTMDELASWSKSGGYVPSEVFKTYALRLFYVSAFGYIDEGIIDSLHHDFKIWIGGFLVASAARIPGTAFDEAMKAKDRILDTVDKMIDKFIEENPEESERAQTTIIGRLIYGKGKDGERMMTRDEMKDNILNLIFAGHDTTYASISTLLYHLSENPDAMDALAEEVSTLKDPLESDELKNAPVLNACIHESWRMDPPVMGGFRTTTVQALEHKGYTFDKGTTFNYSILMASTDKNLYNDHGKFNMKRFLPKDHPLYEETMDSGVDPFQGRSNYPIFGGGTHQCLGKAFAQLELRVLAARMMKHYKVEVRNTQKVVFPVNGWSVEFKLTERKDE